MSLYVIDYDGTGYSCGENCHGQLDLGDTDSRIILTKIPADTRVTQVVCGYGYTVFLDSNGNIYGCSYSAHDQLGLDDTDYIVILIELDLLTGMYTITHRQHC